MLFGYRESTVSLLSSSGARVPRRARWNGLILARLTTTATENRLAHTPAIGAASGRKREFERLDPGHSDDQA